MLAVQFDYNVGSTLEGLDLAFGLTMAIVVCHWFRVDCTNLAHSRKQALKSQCRRTALCASMAWPLRLQSDADCVTWLASVC